MMSRGRVGVLGGSFDPVHNGHLALAREVLARCNFRTVLFVPAARPWQKNVTASVEDRLAMIRLAVADRPDLGISLVDVERAGPTYSIDTLDDLTLLYPADELWFIVGADAAKGMPGWHRSAELMERGNFVIVSRPGEPEPQAPSGMRHLELVDVPSVDVSSSACRNLVKQGKSLSGLVPQAVEDYIEDRGLYRE